MQVLPEDVANTLLTRLLQVYPGIRPCLLELFGDSASILNTGQGHSKQSQRYLETALQFR